MEKVALKSILIDLIDQIDLANLYVVYKEKYHNKG